MLSLLYVLSRISQAIGGSYACCWHQLERSVSLEWTRVLSFSELISPFGKIEQLVYENRQHTVGSMLVHPGERLPVNHIRLDASSTVNSSQSGTLNKQASHNSMRRRYCGKHVRKRVTFKKDSELVSIREIPARENRSDSSDNDDVEDSSSDSETEDSSSATSSDNEDDDKTNGNIVDQISKLVLKHTGVRTAKPVLPTRSIPPRPPRLRRPRVPHAHLKKKDKVAQSKNQTKPKGNNENTRQSYMTVPTVSVGRLTQFRRPQSSVADQQEKVKRRPTSPTAQRSRSAMPSLTFTTRSPNASSVTSIYGSLASVNDRYNTSDNSNTNSGQERTKFYAWQVANGAPLVTTPGISPLYNEQVTVTKLKN